MIKFNQPRYILPLIVLPFIYVFFYMYQTSFGKEQKENVLTETSAINPTLPDPFLNEKDFKDKFDSFLEAHKNKRDHTAMREIDRREKEPDTKIIDTVSIAPKPVFNERAFSTPVNQPLLRLPAQPRLAGVAGREVIPQRQYAKRSAPSQQKASDYEKQMRLFKAQMNYMDSLFDTPTASLRSTSSKVKAKSSKDLNLEKTNRYWSVGEERIKPLVVEKTKGIRSGHFNTIIKDKTGFFIKAMIDEELKVNKESRIRIRLLEDVVIGEQVIPKGKYLYGMVASFKPQRVEVHISSMLLGDQIIEISLDIYDMDGMKGLYVPGSKFRELAKSMGSNMASGQQLNIDESPDNQMQLMYGLAKDAFNTTSQTAAKAIRKNKAKIKYSTMVYLVNTKKQNTSSNNQLTL